MGELSDFMGCSVGDVTFQVDELTSFKQEPIVKDGVGRTGTTVTAEGEGFVRANTQAEMLAALVALNASAFVSGKDFFLRTVNGDVEQQILAAQCMDGGPHVTIEVLDKESGPFYRRVKFTAQAKIPAAGSGGGGGGGVVLTTADAYKVKITNSPSGLRTIARTGSITGPGANAFFGSPTLATFKQTYKSGFVIDYNATQGSDALGNPSDLQTDYEMTARELASPLPDGGGNATVVDGEVTVRVDIDEQLRKTTVTDYDLTLSQGDYQSLVDMLRPPPDQLLTRQSVSFSNIRELKLRASFTVLEGGDGNDLLDWSQTIELTTAADAYAEYTYPGADPIAVRRSKTFTRVVQTGTAKGAGRFPKPPPPVLDTIEQLDPVRLTDVSNSQKQTSWSYRMLHLADTDPDVSTLIAALARPDEPDFY